MASVEIAVVAQGKGRVRKERRPSRDGEREDSISQIYIKIRVVSIMSVIKSSKNASVEEESLSFNVEKCWILLLKQCNYYKGAVITL
jgi:hypothetical protein